jgi:hypothetical protein
MHPHEAVPHFEVTTLDGRAVSYGSIWQQRNLVVLLLPDREPPSLAHAAALQQHAAALAQLDTECVITTDAIAGWRAPALVVADRWGEIAYKAAPEAVDNLPDADETLSWIEYLQHRCPECEGESR